MKCVIFSLATLLFAACGTHQNSESTVAGEVSGDNLWAGAVTSTIQRETDGPCNRSNDMMNSGDVSFSSWARQRAAYTNICFEVWMGGVTDRDGADYGNMIDVQAHYRYESEATWRTMYVNAVGRHGNNMRYAFGMRRTDPFSSSSEPVGIPYRIISRSTDSSGQIWANADSLMEIYFTVNGKILKKNDGWNFFVKYSDGSFVVSE